MTKLKNISSVYFLGIGGIGMSALARYFKGLGARVSGYDRTETVLTKQLQDEGINVHYADDVSLADQAAELVIYTPAIPKGHTEFNFFRNNNYLLLKRSEVLGLVTAETFSVCVAGTHGKTTTSSLIAHILRHSGFGCNAFLGGITANYNTNFWSHERPVSVIEADEYDRSFLTLSPDIAIITSMDPDHLDIYGTAENLQDAFVAFAGKLKEGGYLICKLGLPKSEALRVHDYVSYSLDDSRADVHAVNLHIQDGSYHFDVQLKDQTVHGITLNMGGWHNVENTIAAIAAVKKAGLSDDQVRDAVASFKGVKRRFEYIIRNNGLVMIDDYAHHPEELRALISSAKELYPGKKCTVIFQPHLFSRTNDHADGFAETLGLADETLLMPIYPARELPMPGVSSSMIAEKMTGNVKIVSREEIIQEMKNNRPELLIVAGAGDIDTIVLPLKECLEQ